MSKHEFPPSSRQGIRVFSALFSAVFYKNDREIKVSVVVSKKTAKTAVQRNLTRRRFYDGIREVLGDFTNPGSLVLYPKKESFVVKQAELVKEIKDALLKAKITR